MIINLTPHAITVIGLDGVVLAVLPPSGQVARVTVSSVADGAIDGLPVTRQTMGSITGLPPAVEGVTLLVSLAVRSASGRADLVSPGELVRDAAGQPVGCKGLAR